MFWAEAFGALAVVINFIGYRQDDVNRYRFISALALILVSVHFFMLNAMAAGVACALASLRNIIAMRFRSHFVLVVFVALNIGFFCYEWFVLAHGYLIIIAYVSSLIFTVGSIVIDNASSIRRWFIFAETLGLIYAISVGSIFGTVFNITNLLSIFYKLIQDKPTKSKT